jgi:bifunctional DNA-binding transcriptional regulator/antitoxin component of YhaV-PrlF toxin-antitoxin module
MAYATSPASPKIDKESLLPYYTPMLAKLTSKNQLTIPKKALEALGPPVSHFQVEVDAGRIVLTPERSASLESIWQKIEELGITEQDIKDAVKWARQDR